MWGRALRREAVGQENGPEGPALVGHRFEKGVGDVVAGVDDGGVAGGLVGQ